MLSSAALTARPHHPRARPRGSGGSSGPCSSRTRSRRWCPASSGWPLRVKFLIRDRGSNFTTAFDAVLATFTDLIDHIGTAIGRRTDTRGDAFTITIDGTNYTKRTDADRHLQQLPAQLEQDLLKSSHRRLVEQPGELGGFSVTVPSSAFWAL